MAKKKAQQETERPPRRRRFPAQMTINGVPIGVPRAVGFRVTADGQLIRYFRTAIPGVLEARFE